jgi:hypothetical protein
MNQEQAIEILNQALDQGFKKGAYSLQDAAYVVQALSVLFPPQPQEITEIGKEN